MDPVLTVVVPAFNEEMSVDSTLNELKRVLASLDITSEIIFVDDASTDATAQKVSLHESVVLLRHTVNRGYGASLKTGIRQARGRWICITDCDQTYPLKEIPKLVAGM